MNKPPLGVTIIYETMEGRQQSHAEAQYENGVYHLRIPQSVTNEALPESAFTFIWDSASSEQIHFMVSSESSE
jgi:hypothetical protein